MKKLLVIIGTALGMAFGALYIAEVIFYIPTLHMTPFWQVALFPFAFFAISVTIFFTLGLGMGLGPLESFEEVLDGTVIGACIGLYVAALVLVIV